MNLFDAIQQWLEITIIKPITDRLSRHDTDLSVLAERLLKAEEQLKQRLDGGDLSFFAQRIHTLEKRVEAFVQRLQSIEHAAVDLDAVRRILNDELDGDPFQDRITEFVRIQIENNDSVREEIKDLCKEFLDNELDDLEISIKRG